MRSCNPSSGVQRIAPNPSSVCSKNSGTQAWYTDS